MPVNEFLKSIIIRQRYGQKFDVMFFYSRCILMIMDIIKLTFVREAFGGVL